MYIMERLNRLKDYLNRLKNGMRINHGSAVILQGLGEGSALAGDLALTGLGAASTGLGVVSDAGFTFAQAHQPELEYMSNVGFEKLAQSADVLAQIDEVGLLAPSIATSEFIQDPVKGSIMGADILANTKSDINTNEDYFRLDLPKVRNLPTFQGGYRRKKSKQNRRGKKRSTRRS
jgi:hypothetical protein